MTESLGMEKWKFTSQMQRVFEDQSESKELSYFWSLRVSSLGSLRIVDFTKECLTKKRNDFEMTKRNFITFGIGHAVHDWVQRVVTSQMNRGIFASWKCPKCSMLFEAVDPITCPMCKCTSSNFVYYEPFFHIGDMKEACLGGHTDLIKIINRTKPYSAVIIDIKTINDYLYGKTRDFGPDENYIVQVIMYMYLFGNYIKENKAEMEKKLSFFKDEKTRSVFEIDDEHIFGRIYYLNKNDSSELEFGIKWDERVINRCFVMFDFFKACLKAGKIVEWDLPLDDLNRTVVEAVGKEVFVDMWYPL